MSEQCQWEKEPLQKFVKLHQEQIVWMSQLGNKWILVLCKSWSSKYIQAASIWVFEVSSSPIIVCANSQVSDHGETWAFHMDQFEYTVKFLNIRIPETLL